MPTTFDPSDNSGERHQQSRLESEIEEILERAEREHPLPPPIPFRKRKRNPLGKTLRSPQLKSAGQSMHQWLTTVPVIVAYMFAILAHMLSDISTFLTRIVICLAVIAVFWPLLESFRNNQGSTTSTTMWRGREIDVPIQQGPSRWEQFRQWLRDRRLLP